MFRYYSLHIISKESRLGLESKGDGVREEFYCSEYQPGFLVLFLFSLQNLPHASENHGLNFVCHLVILCFLTKKELSGSIQLCVCVCVCLHNTTHLMI